MINKKDIQEFIDSIEVKSDNKPKPICLNCNKEMVSTGGYFNPIGMRYLYGLKCSNCGMELNPNNEDFKNFLE